MAKKRQQRHVTIEPSCQAFLDTCPGPIFPENTRKKLDALRAIAHITTWPHDALRHTYASHHYNHYRDAHRTAYEIGHDNPTLLHRHYHQQVPPAAAARYFQIMPIQIPYK